MSRFKEWLQGNSTLLPRSIRQYDKVIHAFIGEYGMAVTLENINSFLLKKNISFYRFAFKHFLEFLNRGDVYFKIVKLKRKPKKRFGFYTDKDKIIQLINRITDRKFYLVARIQFLTGARTHDVFGLKKEGDYRIKKNGLIIYLMTKGERKEPYLIPFPEAKEIIDFLEYSNEEYPFLRGSSNNLTTWIDNNYRYYLRTIVEVSEAMGLHGFRPHDFRRNFASYVYGFSGKDIHYTKEALRHKDIKHTTEYLSTITKEEESKKIIEKLRK